MSFNRGKRRRQKHGAQHSNETIPLNRAVIAGGAGFLGQHLARELLDSQWKVTCVGRNVTRVACPGQIDRIEVDISDKIACSRILEDTRPTHLFYLSSPSGVQSSYLDVSGDYLGHVIPMITCLEAVRLHSPETRFVQVSSAAVYGNPKTIPVGEGDELQPVSPYGFHKLAQEALLKEYRTIFGLDYRIARVFSTYGPCLRRLAIWDIALRAKSGDFRLHGTGVESRDYLYVCDVVRAIRLIAESECACDNVFNVASGEETPINDVAVEIYRALAIDAVPVYDGMSLPGSPIRWCAEVGRLKGLGFRPTMSLRCGIGRTIEWIANDQGWNSFD